MNINRWKEKLVAAAAMVTLFPQTVFASAIQDAIEDADTASFDSVDAAAAAGIFVQDRNHRCQNKAYRRNTGIKP